MRNDSQLKYSQKYDKLWNNQWKLIHSIGPSCQTRFRIMMKLVNQYKAKDNVLDVGCGDGFFLQMLAANKFKELAGSDISSVSLKLAKDREIRDVFIGDLCNLETFPSKKYNTIICSEVLEYLDNYELAVKNLSALLNYGGKIIITVPYSMKYWSQHDEFARHFRRYEKGELEKELEKNGFKIVESFVWGALFYNTYYEFLGRMKPEKIMDLSSNKKLKIIISKILFHLFKFDDFLIFTEKGRRIFIVAEK